MEKQSGLEGVLTMTPTVMKFIEEMMNKKREEVLAATHPKIRELIEALLRLDDEMSPKEDTQGDLYSTLVKHEPLPKNGFNI